MQSQHNAAAQPTRRLHPEIPTLEEITRGAPVHSVHLPFLTTIPLPGGVADAKEDDGGGVPQAIKIIYLAASAESNRVSLSLLGLAPSCLTYEPIDSFKGRLDRMLASVARGAALHGANILCIHNVNGAMAERQLKEKLPMDWVVTSFKNECVVAFNGQEYVIDNGKRLEGLERAERGFGFRHIPVVLQHRPTQQVVELYGIYESRPYIPQNNPNLVRRDLDGSTKEKYRDFFQRIPRDRTAILIGVHGVPIAPLDDRPRNITTAVRLDFGKQQAEFYSGAFYCGTNGRIRQADIQTLSFTTGEIAEDPRSKAEIKPGYTVAYISSLDEELYGSQQKRLQLLLGEEVKFTYEVSSNSSHEKKTVLTFSHKKDYQNFKNQFNGDHFQNRISWVDQRQFVVMQGGQLQNLIAELEERKAQQMVTSLLSELPIYQADLDRQEAKEENLLLLLNKKRQAVQVLLAHVQDGSKTAFKIIQMLKNDHAMREHLVTLNTRHGYSRTVLAKLQPLRPFQELAYTAGSVCSYLTTAEVNNLKKVSRSACVLFQEPLQNKQMEKLLDYIAGGNPDEAERMIQQYPYLLTRKGAVKDRAGYTMHGGTPLQIAFDVEEEEMAAMIQYYLMQQPGGEEEVKRQQKKRFPDGYEEEEAERVQADLAALEKVTEAILVTEASTSTSVNEDGFQVINVNVDEHCKKAIGEFHDYLQASKHSKADLLAIAFQFMHTRFLHAEQLAEEKEDDRDRMTARKIVFWRAIIGGIERFVPMCYAQALFTGIVGINKNRLKLNRSYSLYYIADTPNFTFCLARDWAMGCDGRRRPLPPDFEDKIANIALPPDEIGQENQAFQEFHQTKQEKLELVKRMQLPWKKEEEETLHHNETRRKNQCLVM